MQCVRLAKSAIFFCLHSVRMGFLIFRRIVITLFAFCTCQCDSCTHSCYLRLLLFLSIKKRPEFILSVYYITALFFRQLIYFKKNAKNSKINLIIYKYRPI